MKLANELKLEKVIFETDCSKVAEILWFGYVPSYSTQPSWQGTCIEELSNHQDWQLKLIRREANDAADVMAKQCKRHRNSIRCSSCLSNFLKSFYPNRCLVLSFVIQRPLYQK